MEDDMAVDMAVDVELWLILTAWLLYDSTPPSPRAAASIATLTAPDEPQRHQANGARPVAANSCDFGPRAAFVGSAMLPGRLGVQRQRRLFVIAASHAAIGKHAVRGNPFERLLVHFFGIGLENQPFARSPAPRIHHRMEAIGEFVVVIMGVEFRPQVDITLRPPQRPDESSQIFWIWVAVDHGRNHEGGIDDFAEAKLLGEIIRTAE